MDYKFRETLIPPSGGSHNAFRVGDGGGSEVVRARATTWSLDSGGLMTMRMDASSIALDLSWRTQGLHLLIPSNSTGQPDFAIRGNALDVAFPCGNELAGVRVDLADLSILDVKTTVYPGLDSRLTRLAEAGRYGATESGNIYALDTSGASREVFYRDPSAASERRGFLPGFFAAEKRTEGDLVALTVARTTEAFKSVLFATVSGNIYIEHAEGPDASPKQHRRNVGCQLSSARESYGVCLDGGTYVLAFCTEKQSSGRQQSSFRVFLIGTQDATISISERKLPANLTVETAVGVARKSSREARVVFADGKSFIVSTEHDLIDPDKVWTLEDDLGAAGCWGSTDQYVQSVEDILFTPGRFSNFALATAMQRPLAASLVSRSELLLEVKDFLQVQKEKNNGNSDEDLIAQLSRRATQATLSTETEAVGCGEAPGHMTSVLRRKGVCIVRPLVRVEKQALCEEDRSHNGADQMGMDLPVQGPWAWTLAASSALQVASCAGPDARTSIPIIRRPSDSDMDRGLGLVAGRFLEDNLRQQGSALTTWTFGTCIEEVMSMLSPSPLLLRFLAAIREYGTLAEAAVLTGDRLPASSHFCAGLAALADFGSQTAQKTLDQEQQRVANREASAILNMFLSGASALEKSTREDIDTVAKLLLIDDIKDHSAERVEFWYRERVVRMFESVRAFQAAATCAVDAMHFASTRRNYEVMRSVVFRRFLDHGDLEKALAAILYPPYRGAEREAAVPAEDFWTESEAEVASALRDMVATFTATVLNARKMDWLASCALPEPISRSVRAALLRLAKSSDVMVGLGSGHTVYEDLIAWDMIRGDVAGVAQGAYEWSRRLLEERKIGTRLNLWTKARSTSLHTALAALKHMPESQQFVQSISSKGAVYFGATRYEGNVGGEELRKDLSQMAIDDTDECTLDSLADLDEPVSDVPTVGVPDMERLALLANAQAMIFARDGELGSADMLTEESAEATEFVISRLCCYGYVREAAELAVAWTGATHSERFTELVARATASAAAALDDWNLLRIVMDGLLVQPGSTVNFPLTALEGVLLASSGSVSPPQWLLEQACGNGGTNNVLGLLLRYGRRQEAMTMAVSKISTDGIGYHALHSLVADSEASQDPSAGVLLDIAREHANQAMA